MLEKIQKNYKVLIKYAVMLIAILFVLKAGMGEIRYVLSRGLQTYHVNEAVMETVPTNEIIKGEFLCVGKVMDSIQVEVVVTSETKGDISYNIIDSNGNIVIENTCDILSLCNEELKGIYIDVKECSLVQGERYTIYVDFSKTINAAVTLGAGQLSIRQIFEPQYTGVAVAVIICFMTLGIGWLFIVDRKGYSARVFFVTSLIVGLFVAMFMPPCIKDDEYRHFIRAYTDAVDYAYIEEKVPTGIESGIIGVSGDLEYIATVPYEINEIRLLDYEENFNGHGYHQEGNTRLCIDKLVATLKAEPTDQMYEVSATATATRSDIYYWPQIVAMQIAAFFGVTDLLLYYVARFGQVCVCVLFEALAIKLAPKLKEMIWLLAFVPNALFLKASCNCDGLLISEMILLVAVVVWLKEEKIDLFSSKGVLGMFVYALLTYNIIVMKIPYIIVCAGMLIYLGRDNFVKLFELAKRDKKITTIVIGSIVVCAIIGFIIIDKSIFLNLVFKFLPEEHFYYILENPGYILNLFVRKWWELLENLYVGMDGKSIISYPITVVILIAMLKKNQPLIKRAWYAVLFAIMIMVIVLVGYIMTPPDYGRVWGVSYRYLLPFVLTGALCLPSGNEKSEAVAKSLMPVCIFVVAISTLLAWCVWWSV